VLAFNSTKIVDDGFGVPLCRLIFAYRLKPNATGDGYDLEKAEQTDCGGTVGTGGSDFAPITDPNVVITNFRIKLTSSGPERYPLAFLKLSGYAGSKEKERTYFDLQTAVSPRVPN
ncbi:MAG: hypothetical protein V4481_05645, partial [Patescibacteria group bacterium]